jgi:predicted aconitase with swiveling domain
MAANLDAFKTAFSNTYQEVFQKVLVAMKIANTRLLSDLYYGKAIERVAVDISAANVEDITAYTDMTSQVVSDAAETLTVDQNKGIMFQLSEKEIVQAGPLNPGEFIGAKLAEKVAIYVDGDVLAQTVNAAYAFDNGDLTTMASTGSPITINSTTAPQMAMRMPAKLRKNNQTLSNLAFVIDSYGISDLFQYLLGKNADFVNSMFQNGYVGEQVAGAKVYVSENLTGEAVLALATTPTDGDTVTINGTVFTFKTALGSTAGNVLISGSADAARANLTALINAPSVTTTYGVALASADVVNVSKTLRLTATNDNSANTMTVVGKGSGRLTVSETLTDGTDAWSKNFIHSYFGKEGAIDVVIQKDVKADMRPEPKQPTTNIISRVLYGIKTFADGSRKFLDVKISA